MVSISEKLNLKPQLSGADIKSLYEAEVDTNAYTDAEKTSVSTALQPDQTEIISGDYTFNGALILPNNSRINGTEHFYQTTKPTVRGDSSALVAGDRWYKTDDGTEWFWNGTYWLSPEKNWHGYLTGSSNFAGSSMALSDALGQLRYEFILTRVFWASNITTCDNSNFWRVWFGPNIRNGFTGIDNGNGLGFNIPLFEVRQSGYIASQSTVLNIVPTQNANTYITSSVIYLEMSGSPSPARIYLSLFFSSIFP